MKRDMRQILRSTKSRNLVLLFVIAMLIIPVAMIIMAAKAAEGGPIRGVKDLPPDSVEQLSWRIKGMRDRKGSLSVSQFHLRCVLTLSEVSLIYEYRDNLSCGYIKSFVSKSKI